MDANTLLIDIMHNPCRVPRDKLLRITRRCKVGICDDVPFAISNKFYANDQHSHPHWRSATLPTPGEIKIFNWVACVGNDAGRIVVIDLRDVFIADEL